MSKQNDSGAAPMELTRRIERWNYDKSVEKMRPLVKQWKNATVEMLRELYLAREFLTHQKGQYRDPDAPNYLIYSWSGYCGHIGLKYQTVNAWLRSLQFVPRELSENGRDTLLLLDAPPKEDTAADRALMQSRIAEVIRTGERPADWSNEENAEYRRQMKSAEIAGLTKKYNALAFSKARDYFSETMHRSKDIVNFKLRDHELLQAQINAFRYIEAYLAIFDDSETKAKAAFNLALKTRNLANELAEQNFQLSEAEVKNDV